MQSCSGFPLICILLLLQQIVQVCRGQIGNVADAMTLFCESFEQGGLQNIVVRKQAMLAFCFLGLKSLIPLFPNAKGGGGNTAQA